MNMMDTKGKIKLNYPDEFRIACKINNLKHEELVQYFIDHVSFYAFIGGEMDPQYMWATTVNIDCKEVSGESVSPISNVAMQEISLRYIKALTSLIGEDNLGASEGTARSTQVMKDWSVEMLPLTDYQDNIYTDSGDVFSLTFDFNLLCRLNGLSIVKLLQYFVDHISLARERALNLNNEFTTDPSTAVLLILLGGHGDLKNRELPHQETYKKYGLKLLRLDKQQRGEDQAEKRIINYSTFYKEWYDELLKN